MRAFVRKPFAAERLEAQGVEAFLGDMTEQESVHKALQGIESVYLISPVTAHLFATEQLWAEEARRAGVRYLVKQSEIGADPQSLSPLLQYHGRAEDAIRTSGVPYTILRTLYFMQNFARYSLRYCIPRFTTRPSLTRRQKKHSWGVTPPGGRARL